MKLTKAQREAETAISEWQSAYREANSSEPPECHYENGWVIIRDRFTERRRVSHLKQMAGNLRHRDLGRAALEQESKL